MKIYLQIIISWVYKYITCACKHLSYNFPYNYFRTFSKSLAPSLSQKDPPKNHQLKRHAMHNLSHAVYAPSFPRRRGFNCLRRPHLDNSSILPKHLPETHLLYFRNTSNTFQIRMNPLLNKCITTFNDSFLQFIPYMIWFLFVCERHLNNF